MQTLGIIVGLIPFTVWVLLLLQAFYCVVVDDYLNDGDLGYESWLEKLFFNEIDAGVRGMLAFCIMLGCTIVSSILGALVFHHGDITLPVLVGIAVASLVLYTLRGVIRLRKRLAKHESDTNAHQKK